MSLSSTNDVRRIGAAILAAIAICIAGLAGDGQRAGIRPRPRRHRSNRTSTCSRTATSGTRTSTATSIPTSFRSTGRTRQQARRWSRARSRRAHRSRRRSGWRIAPTARGASISLSTGAGSMRSWRRTSGTLPATSSRRRRARLGAGDVVVVTAGTRARIDADSTSDPLARASRRLEMLWLCGGHTGTQRADSTLSHSARAPPAPPLYCGGMGHTTWWAIDVYDAAAGDADRLRDGGEQLRHSHRRVRNVAKPGVRARPTDRGVVRRADAHSMLRGRRGSTRARFVHRAAGQALLRARRRTRGRGGEPRRAESHAMGRVRRKTT